MRRASHPFAWALPRALLMVANASAQQGAAQTPTLEQRIAERAVENRLRLEFDGARFSGPAFDRLVEEGRAAQFFLLGEEHGIAENPKLAAALFRALVPAGYSKFAIEISPPMAFEIDRAILSGGMTGLARFYERPGGVPAFFGMREEAEMLVDVRAAASGRTPVLWGADYEVGGDRILIARLAEKPKPSKAATAFAALKQASDESWSMFEQTKSPQYVFSFGGDPALVRAVRDAWPKGGTRGRDAESDWILDTLEETLEINRLWLTRQGYASNERRSANLRENFLRHWRAEKKAGRAPKVFAKFGASHLVRGRNMVETFDLGALLPELAALDGAKSYHLLVLPGAGSMTAVFNPMEWRYAPAPAKDGAGDGLGAITGAAFPDAFTLIDLRPLRPLLGFWREGVDPNLMRVVHGFDAVLVLSGSTPSRNFEEAAQ